MPTPEPREKREDFVDRCIPIVIEDGTAEDGAQAAAICNSMWEEAKREKRMNNLKTVGKTETELRVANHIVLFGGRDLEGIASPRVNQDGSQGEYFAPETDLESDYTKTGMLYVDWEHGLGKMDHPDAPGPDNVLGYVDWKTAVRDELGVWVERVLDRRNKYVRYLEELIDAGLIGNSSEAVSDGIERKANGLIARWPLKRDTLTVNPMEPRMLTANVVTALKALELVPDLEAATGEGEAITEPTATDKGEKQAINLYTVRAVENLLAQRKKDHE